MNLRVLLPAVVAGAVSAWVVRLLVPLVRELALALRAVDLPGGRRQHRGEVPRLGGIAIASGVMVGVSAVLLLWRGAHSQDVTQAQGLALALGAGLVFLVGVADDVVGVSVMKRLVTQVMAAWLVVGAGWSFSHLGLPIIGDVHLGPVGPVVSIVWIVAVTNAVNLLDGLDGLAAGVAVIISASMVVYGIVHGSFFAVIQFAAIAGSCAGFLPHNRAPARIFMGDSGSLTLGYLLGAVSVCSTLKAPTAVAILVPILALGVPVIDALLVMLLRFLHSSSGSSWERVARVFRADRTHLHHLLESVSPHHRSIVHSIYLLVLVSCAMALVVAFSKSPSVGWALVLVELCAIALIRQLGWSRTMRGIATQHRPPTTDQEARMRGTLDDRKVGE